MSNGVALVCTSNRSPDELYLDGLNREALFLPFISYLKERCDVYHLKTSQDYRLSAKDNDYHKVCASIYAYVF